MQIDTCRCPNWISPSSASHQSDDVDTDLAREVAGELIRGYLDFCISNDADPTDAQTNFLLFIAPMPGRNWSSKRVGSST